jgi:hypothetical protein
MCAEKALSSEKATGQTELMFLQEHLRASGTKMTRRLCMIYRFEKIRDMP